MGSRDIGQSLIRELQVFLRRDGILNLHKDDRRRDEETPSEQSPARRELVDEGGLQRIDPIDHHRPGRLDPFIEPCEIGELATVVGQGAHVP